MAEGWVIIKGERRFIPLGTQERRRHCKSCTYYRKSYGGYCELDPQAFVSPESEACNDYLNRTWGQKNEQ